MLKVLLVVALVLLLITWVIDVLLRKAARAGKQTGESTQAMLIKRQAKTIAYDLGRVVLKRSGLGVVDVRIGLRVTADLETRQQEELSERMRVECLTLSDRIVEIVFNSDKGRSGPLTDLAVEKLEPVVVNWLKEKGITGDVSSVYLTVPLECRVIEDWRPVEIEPELAPV